MLIRQGQATYALRSHSTKRPATENQVAPDSYSASGPSSNIPSRREIMALSVPAETLLEDGLPTQQDGLGLKHYREGAPERYWLYPLGEPGERFWMPGAVKGMDGQPIQGAKVEFWVANDAGEYSQDDFAGRGWQSTDESGSYQLHCVRPGPEGEKKAPYLNVRVSAPEHETLNTRLFFEDDIYNRFDPGFQKERELELGSLHWGNYKYFTSSFDFVLKKSEPQN